QRGSADVRKRVRRDRNRVLADANLGEIRWQLQSKAAWYACQVQVADRHAATGRTCSACGQVRVKPVPPAEELFACPACGWCGDRRWNTARVLAAVARGEHQQYDDAPSGGESLNARGGDVRPAALRRGGRSSLKREARARPPGRGETGTPGPLGPGVLSISMGYRCGESPGHQLGLPRARGRRDLAFTLAQEDHGTSPSARATGGPVWDRTPRAGDIPEREGDGHARASNSRHGGGL